MESRGTGDPLGHLRANILSKNKESSHCILAVLDWLGLATSCCQIVLLNMVQAMLHQGEHLLLQHLPEGVLGHKQIIHISDIFVEFV